MPLLQPSVPRKRTLILLTSLAITLLFTVPRLAVVWQIEDSNLNFTWTDFGVKTIYSFVLGIVFLTLNLENRKFRLLGFSLELSHWYQRLLLSFLLFLIIRFFAIRFHLMFFDPVVSERVFRFFFTITVLLEVLVIVLIGQIYHLLFHNQQMNLANADLRKTNAEAQYEVLKNQVNPHFLFNSFNTINSLIQQDSTMAMNFVSNLSDVFRYVLSSHSLDTVTLEEEMQFMQAYQEMLKGRHGDKLRFTIHIPPTDLSKHLPPMALQILVENAVKHNIVSNRKPLCIRIATHPDATLTVTNPLQERGTPQPSTGMGLSNLNQRCQYICQREIMIQRTDTTFSVTIPLVS